MSEFLEFEDETDIEEAAPAAKKKKPARKKSKPTPPSVYPFQIHKRDPSLGKYLWIKEWPGKKPPGPSDIRDEYGRGSYIVRDAVGNDNRWQIGDDPTDAPDLPSLDSFAAPEEPRYEPPRVEPAPQQSAPPTLGGFSSPSVSPQLQALVYRLDATNQSIERDIRRIQDEQRSIIYELQQIPARTAERVAQSLRDQSDPFDQMARVYDMSQRIADGKGPADDGGGLSEIIAGVLGALGSKGPQALTPPPPQPPPPQPHVQAHPGNGNYAQPVTPPAGPELPGMTPEIRAELVALASQRGVEYPAAIAMALERGWDAPTLLDFARNPDPSRVAS